MCSVISEEELLEVKRKVYTVTTLEVRKAIPTLNLGRMFLDGFGIDWWADLTGKRLWAKMHAYLISKKVHVDEYSQTVGVYSAPETWWDHFKARFYPYWLLKRFPVTYKEIEMTVNHTVNHIHVCPHTDLSWKDRSDIHLFFIDGDDVDEHKEEVEN